MTPKFLLCLALVLIGALFGCLPNTRAGENVTNIPALTNLLPTNGTAATPTRWTDVKVTVYRATGESVQLDAKSAVYSVQTATNNSRDFLYVAFVDPQNGRAWIGFADGDRNSGIKDFYVETDSEIVGAWNGLFAGDLGWRESLITNAEPGIGMDRLINRFNEEIDLSNSVEEMFQTSLKARINLSPYFRDWFFYPHVGVSYIGGTPIQHIDVHDGKMRLDFTSPALGIPGSAWIDLKTRKLVKAVEDGKRVYPK